MFFAVFLSSITTSMLRISSSLHCSKNIYPSTFAKLKNSFFNGVPLVKLLRTTQQKMYLTKKFSLQFSEIKSCNFPNNRLRHICFFRKFAGLRAVVCWNGDRLQKPRSKFSENACFNLAEMQIVSHNINSNLPNPLKLTPPFYLTFCPP